MSSKSRVILYAELRKKISDIDTYSFDNHALSMAEEEKAVAEDCLPDEKEIPKPERSDEGIKRNTFSMSIDELIKEHNLYDTKTQEKETQAKIQKMKKEKRHSSKPPVFRIVLWSSIGLVLVVFITLLILILTEVI